MVLTLLFGSVGSFVLTPVCGIAVYYMYSIVRPQFLWDWALPPDPGWSFMVAVSTLAATAVWRLGLFAPVKVAAPPWYGEPPYTRSHYLFLAFVGWICLTYPTAMNTDRAYPFFVEYVKIFVMFIAATLILRTVRDLWLIYMVVLVCAVYVGYEINFLYVVHQYLILQSRGYCGLDNNGAALILAMAVPMAFFAWEAMRHWFRWVFLLAIPMLVHGVLLSYSRGAMLSLCFVAPLILVRTRNKMFIGAIYAGLALAMPFMAGKEIRERFFSISKADVDDSANSRRTTWKIAVRMANERPLFGYGIRNSNLLTYKYGADIPGRSIHSQYLQTAADSGWAGMGLYLAVIASVFAGMSEVRRHLRPFNDPDSRRVKSLASGLETSLVLFCFGAIFLSLEHFEMPYIVMLLAMQLLAITRAVTSRLAGGAGPPGYPYPPPAGPNPVPAAP
jgi:probable O-glycosylation ligase (exosortase A-associated)